MFYSQWFVEPIQVDNIHIKKTWEVIERTQWNIINDFDFSEHLSDADKNKNASYTRASVSFWDPMADWQVLWNQIVAFALNLQIPSCTVFTILHRLFLRRYCRW